MPHLLLAVSCWLQLRKQSRAEPDDLLLAGDTAGSPEHDVLPRLPEFGICDEAALDQLAVQIPQIPVCQHKATLAARLATFVPLVLGREKEVQDQKCAV